jgi:phosphoglycerate dehydrogenase-like enzyme
MLAAVLAYDQRRPAFAVLLTGADRYSHEPNMRARLRAHVATILLPHATTVSPSTVERVAEISVQIIKAFSSAAGNVGPSNQEMVMQEYCCVLRSYLQVRFSPAG